MQGQPLSCPPSPPPALLLLPLLLLVPGLMRRQPLGHRRPLPRRRISPQPPNLGLPSACGGTRLPPQRRPWPQRSRQSRYRRSLRRISLQVVSGVRGAGFRMNQGSRVQHRGTQVAKGLHERTKSVSGGMHAPAHLYSRCLAEGKGSQQR
jgi:hypothetical protein